MARRFSQFRAFGFPDGGDHTGRGNQDRAKHLEMVKGIREGTLPAPRNLGDFAGVMLSIPELDYYVLVQRFPDLRSPDHEIKRNAWLKFQKDPASEPYRIHRKTRGPQCRSLTAR